jgi:hypothetical protein
LSYLVKIVRFFIFIFAICLNLDIQGQNLENIGKEKPLKVNGGISVNQIFYDAVGSQSSRSPYTYYLSGNLNFNLYGWSVPFSYTYSNQQSSFQQPFNQYSLNPTYKWITAHVGYTSMTFSPYTLNGHQFLGVGVELSPGSKFKFSAMYGRLQKAVEYDTSNTGIQPAYQRIGYGFKGGVNFGKATVELMAFHSKDDLVSLKHNVDSLELYPEENLALGINSSISFIEKLSFQVEFGSSFITRDIRSEKLSDNFLYTERTSTEKYSAVKAGLKYTQTSYSAGLTYERIDPGYRTHGAYYFNNDLENIATNITTSLFKKKLNLGANVGIQQDDLDNTKMSKMLRVVNSYNVGFVPVNQLNISATYSNFKSHTNVKSQFQDINQLTTYENLDTLDFTQISENTSLNVNYTLLSTEKSRQNLSFNSVYQKASEYQEQVQTNSGTKFWSMNIAHSLTFVKTNTSFSTSINYSKSKTSTLTTYTIGPTVSLRRNFFNNKLRSSLSTSFNNSYSNGELTNTVLNIRMNTGYTWQKKHNFNLTGANNNRMSRSSGVKKKSKEYTVTLGYTYNF